MKNSKKVLVLGALVLLVGLSSRECVATLMSKEESLTTNIPMTNSIYQPTEPKIKSETSSVPWGKIFSTALQYTRLVGPYAVLAVVAVKGFASEKVNEITSAMGNWKSGFSVPGDEKRRSFSVNPDSVSIGKYEIPREFFPDGTTFKQPEYEGKIMKETVYFSGPNGKEMGEIILRKTAGLLANTFGPDEKFYCSIERNAKKSDKGKVWGNAPICGVTKKVINNGLHIYKNNNNKE